MVPPSCPASPTDDELIEAAPLEDRRSILHQVKVTPVTTAPCTQATSSDRATGALQTLHTFL
ncbi:MAG: hypothetical protein ACKO4L_01455 [Nodosilinea sp.]